MNEHLTVVGLLKFKAEHVNETSLLQSLCEEVLPQLSENTTVAEYKGYYLKGPGSYDKEKC